MLYETKERLGKIEGIDAKKYFTAFDTATLVLVERLDGDNKMLKDRLTDDVLRLRLRRLRRAGAKDQARSEGQCN